MNKVDMRDDARVEQTDQDCSASKVRGTIRRSNFGILGIRLVPEAMIVYSLEPVERYPPSCNIVDQS